MFSDRFWPSKSFVFYSILSSIRMIFFNIESTDEEAFVILLNIAEWLDFLYLCDFMGLSLGMPFSEAL